MIGSYSDLLDKRSLHFTRRKLREKSFFSPANSYSTCSGRGRQYFELASGVIINAYQPFISLNKWLFLLVLK